MKIEKYTRKKFVVDAVQVTADNMPHVADWCGGIMKKAADGKEFIQVQVFRALNDRQKQAYPGDWVRKAGRGFKVYTDKGFRANFEKEEGVV